jgi:CRP-like cAMP-binding protein
MTLPVASPGDVIDRAPTALDRLPPAVRTRLEPIERRIEVEAGAVVLREGVDTPFLGAIETGRLALRLRMAEKGDRLTVVTLEAGELLGWSAIVPPHRATVDAIATEPTRILALDAAGLRDLLAADCDIAAALLPLVVEAISGRLTASWSQLLDMYGVGEDRTR